MIGGILFVAHHRQTMAQLHDDVAVLAYLFKWTPDVVYKLTEVDREDFVERALALLPSK